MSLSLCSVWKGQLYGNEKTVGELGSSHHGYMLLVRTRKWQKLLHTAEPGQVVWGRGHSGKLDLKDKAPKGQDKAQEGIQGRRSGKKGVTVGILH